MKLFNFVFILALLAGAFFSLNFNHTPQASDGVSLAQLGKAFANADEDDECFPDFMYHCETYEDCLWAENYILVWDSVENKHKWVFDGYTYECSTYEECYPELVCSDI